MRTEPELTNPEFAHAADQLLERCRNLFAKKGNKSPTKKQLLDMAKRVLENRL